MKENLYYAHIDDERRQTVEEHLRSVAELASKRLSCIGLGSVGYLLGIIHDMGKFTEKFNCYISLAAKGETVIRGSVNHTFAGVIFVWERFHDKEDACGKLLCELICCAVGSHHGLFDCLDPDGKSGFLHRLKKDRDELSYNEAVNNFLDLCADAEEIDGLFNKAKEELAAILPSLNKCFYVAALERLLASALIDADRTDTAGFMFGKEDKRVELADIVVAAYSKLEDRLKSFDTISPIQQSRRIFSDKCKAFADRPCGVYRLDLPTGAGKTLAALRFALAKANAYPRNVQRIFYVAPLLTVLEQNADEIRKSVGNTDWVLEHHSNVVIDEGDSDELSRYELLTENWSAPIIVTTLVQLLNTLFSGKTGCIRRMQALYNAVIVIDEIQSLPLKTLSLFNGMVNFLSGVCGTTIILCSATQPELADSNIKMKLNTNTDPDMIPYDAKLWEPFARSYIIDGRTKYGMTSEELAGLAIEKLLKFNSVLLICNTRRAAADVFFAAKHAAPDDADVIHLSAAMCRMHRRDRLERIRACISKGSGRKTICVSTQLIEAGVDISFGCVIRTLAGIDSIAQAAGRCNRHGELKLDGAPALGEVIITRYRDEKITFLKEIAQAQNAAEALMNDYSKAPERYDSSLLSDKSVSAYYSELYGQVNRVSSGKTEYPVNIGAVSTTAFAMLSKNEAFARAASAEVQSLNQVMRQAFKTAGDSFEVFDEGSSTVIVPYDETADKIINDLCAFNAFGDIKRAKALIESAKPYTVTIYDVMKRRLEEAGAILACCDGKVLAVNPCRRELYDRDIGLSAPKFGGKAYIL